MRCLLVGLAAGLLLMSAQARAAFTAINEPDRRDMVFDQNDVLYVTISGGTLVRYNAKTNTLLSPWTVGGNPAGIDINPNGGLLAVGDTQVQGANIRFLIVNRISGVATPVSLAHDTNESGTWMMAWGSDNRLLFSTAGASIRRYDPASGQIS